MKFDLEIQRTSEYGITKKDMQDSIDSLNRLIDGKHTTADLVICTDIISILRGIQSQCPTRI